MWINQGWLLGKFPTLTGISETELRRVCVCPFPARHLSILPSEILSVNKVVVLFFKYLFSNINLMQYVPG